LRSNGTYPVKVKTINGSFDFELNRFKSDKGSTNFFISSGIFQKGESYESNKLKDFVSYYATKMSYEMVSELTMERCGGVSISDQHIQQIVIEKVAKVGLLQDTFIKKASLVNFLF